MKRSIILSACVLLLATGCTVDRAKSLAIRSLTSMILRAVTDVPPAVTASAPAAAPANAAPARLCRLRRAATKTRRAPASAKMVVLACGRVVPAGDNV